MGLLYKTKAKLINVYKGFPLRGDFVEQLGAVTAECKLLACYRKNICAS